jgi:hypothetical protein
MDQGVVVHQLTLLLTSNRREPEAQSSASAEAGDPNQPAVDTAKKEEPPRRCLNESAHKLYR